MIFGILLELLPNGRDLDYKKNLYSTSAYVQAARVRERENPSPLKLSSSGFTKKKKEKEKRFLPPHPPLSKRKIKKKKNVFS